MYTDISYVLNKTIFANKDKRLKAFCKQRRERLKRTVCYDGIFMQDGPDGHHDANKFNFRDFA